MTSVIKALWGRILAAVMMGIITACLWPESSDGWRKVAGIILSVGLGFQITTAIGAARQGPAAAIMAWLDCAAFPLVMVAFLHLPSLQGWLLLISAWAWRLLVKNLWK
ncbi:hypothetical protein EI77_02775 [Prosthecobacter fusiformis]|uniref:Uncharacterized protein n=1 Tax=Prosthecobacter fusiformis TaxID=48464 RepID=A0A4R7S181_9BACT|nr:hypothetical protein [Prosthecobacter fusiformis]TDU70727.1 hypothetical protein EI77_02775 [Prosthecobacter fusiformis]